MEAPETRYVRGRDGAFIAFQVFGAGPIDVLLLPGFFTNLDENWRIPEIADTLERIGRFARVIAMDRRGVGLSDRLSPGDTAPLETHVDDVVAVLDAAKAREVCLFTSESGAPLLAILFAAAHHERVRALALYVPIKSNPLTALIHGILEADGTGTTEEAAIMRWGSDAFARADLEAVAPSIVGDAAAVRAWSGYLRASASPGSALAMYHQWWETEIRDILPTVRTPTLILTRPDAWGHGTSASFVEEIRAGIPGARVAALSGRDLPWWIGDRAAFVAELEEFFTGARTLDDHSERGLATVLFTDIVDSTARSAAIGDDAWQGLRLRHDAIVRAELAAHRGVEIKTIGDGFLATFDGPARAARCATAIVNAMPAIGVEVRAGLHTGEVTREGDDVSGIAVAIGARTSSVAGPSEVLATQTVKDLTVGSGLTFDDAGEHELKGVPDRWRLYRVVDA